MGVWYNLENQEEDRSIKNGYQITKYNIISIGHSRNISNWNASQWTWRLYHHGRKHTRKCNLSTLWSPDHKDQRLWVGDWVTALANFRKTRVHTITAKTIWMPRLWRQNKHSKIRLVREQEPCAGYLTHPVYFSILLLGYFRIFTWILDVTTTSIEPPFLLIFGATAVQPE